MPGAATALDHHEKEKKLLAYDKDDRVILAFDKLKELKEAGAPRLCISTGLPSLDAAIGGFYTGQMIVVSGVSGHGKTTLCQSFTQSMVIEQVRSLWFSYEVDERDFLEQFNPLALHYFYLPRKLAGKALTWLEDRILEAKLKFGICAVFIDHLHRLLSLDKTSHFSLDIGYIVSNLKAMAIRHSIVLFLVCHTKQAKPDAELGLGDIRDSSFIEQEADEVLYVWRSKRENHSIVKVAKNRKKGVIDVKIELKYEDGIYYEPEKK